MRKSDHTLTRLESWKLLIFLAVYYSVFDFINISKYYLLSLYEAGNPFPPLRTLINLYLFDWIFVVGFMWGIALFTEKLVEKKVAWGKIAILHLSLSILLTFIIRFTGDLLNILLGILEAPNYSFSRALFYAVRVMDYNFLIYFSMLFIIYSFFYLRQSKLNEARKLFLEEQLSENKIKMLTSQLHPHFFFNTLNCISSLIQQDQNKAQKTLMDLSNFFREVLREKGSQLITIERELKTLRHYINILKVRFSEQLSVKEIFNPQLLKEKIPALSIQPLVENAIKHGFSKNHLHLEIIISIREIENRLIIKIENNGARLKNPEEIDGMGISNLKERLETIYGPKASFVLRNKEETKGIENIISIDLT